MSFGPNLATRDDYIPFPNYTPELENRFDWNSIIGRYNVASGSDDRHVPTVYRKIGNCEKQFVSVKMGSVAVLDMLQSLPKDVYNSVKLDTSRITTAEADQFNVINEIHCERRFGADSFTTGDLVTRLEDLWEFHEFVLAATDILRTGQNSNFTKLGFLKLGTGEAYPYSVLPCGTRVLPLEYCKSRKPKPEKKSFVIDGLPLAYLKIGITIHAGKNTAPILLPQRTMKVVDEDEFKTFFPVSTTFERRWPRSSGKSYLLEVPKGAPEQTKTEKWYHEQPTMEIEQLEPIRCVDATFLEVPTTANANQT